jgi:serine/threonine protein kinase
VCLGWKSQLTDPLTSRPKDKVNKALVKAAAQPGGGDSADDRALGILPGDCLRLRNYVFRVRAIAPAEDVGDVYLCDQRVATVIQERLSAYVSSKLEQVEVLNLPNFSVLKRPNPSVDVFSFGALALYCLFAGSSPNSEERQRAEEKSVTLDDAFAGTMEVLESVPYVDILWRDCEAIRSELELLRNRYKIDRNLSPAYAPKHMANVPSHLKLGKQSQDEQKEMYELTRTVANNILQSTPHATWILEKLDYNLAKFVLLIQFVLSCLHYADDLTGASKGSMLPICPSRRESEEGDVAAELKRRFENLMISKGPDDPALFDSPATQEFCVPKDRRKEDILRFDPRSDFFIRVDNTRLKDKNKELDGELKGLKDRLDDATTKVGELHTSVGGLEEQLKSSRASAAQIKQVKELSGKLPRTHFNNYESTAVRRLLEEINKL